MFDSSKIRFQHRPGEADSCHEVLYGVTRLGFVEQNVDHAFVKTGQPLDYWHMCFGGCYITRNTDGVLEPTRESAAEVLYLRMVERYVRQLRDDERFVRTLVDLDANNEALDVIERLLNVVAGPSIL